jgi:hypothetical protein
MQIYIFTGHYVAGVLPRIKYLKPIINETARHSPRRLKPVDVLRIKLSQRLPDNRHPSVMVADDDKVKYLSILH